MITRRERGVVLIIAAVSMTALMVMVALVIDLGAKRNERSHARSAADAAATAGALGLTVPTSTLAACEAAFGYAFLDLDEAVPSAGAITTACGPLTAACTTGGAARTASLTSGSVVVEVTNPVPDGSALLQGTLVGGGSSQTLDAAVDGLPCERLAVQITAPQSKFFGGIVYSGTHNFTVHAVARYSPNARPPETAPALVTLNQSACRSIDAGNNGSIVILATSNGPGIAYSDSDGPSCTTANPILNATNAAHLIAEAFGTTPGQLSWYAAPATRGWADCGSSCALTVGTRTASQRYVGALSARPTRITRAPADRRYHCTVAPVTPAEPLCAASSDPIATAIARAAATSAPAGFTTWTGACDSTGGVTMGAAGDNIWVNCPVFSVKGGELRIAGGGTIIFTGRLSIEANGRLSVNVNNPPTADSGGYPVPASTSRQTTLVVGSTAADALSIQSTSAEMWLAQTALISRGGVNIQGSPIIRWTPPGAPATGGFRSLMYWSESTTEFHLQGSPVIAARGVLFHGNGALTASGSGTLNLANVQAWVNTTSLSGSPTLQLAPDPNHSIATSAAGTQIIR